jgi:flavin reductase (DIM6/NTAB) family NADH-FMN oxidoreductase RutF
MHIDVSQQRASVIYQHLVHIIAPRPIAWVSTVSAKHVTNLAPFSFFCGVGSRPPSLLFCPVNSRSGAPKDTLRNVLETGEFVVNVVPFRLAELMNLSSTELESEVSEFATFGIKAAPSSVVRPPGVAASPVRIECRLLQHLPLSAEPGGANIVVGEIVHMFLDDGILNDRGLADASLMDLVGRMGGDTYCRTQDVFPLARP